MNKQAHPGGTVVFGGLPGLNINVHNQNKNECFPLNPWRTDLTENSTRAPPADTWPPQLTGATTILSGQVVDPRDSCLE